MKDTSLDYIDEKVVDLMMHLQSSKFHIDPTIQVADVCEKCQALKVNKEGYDIIESYKLKHQSKEGQHEDNNRGITEG